MQQPNTLSVAISSGKGGVGKTLTVIQLALSIQRQGNKVLILDGDFGLANVDIILGLQVKHNLQEVLNGHISLNDIVIEGPEGIGIIPSGSGVSSLQQLSYVQRQMIKHDLMDLEQNYDVILVDTAAGIGSNVCLLNQMSQQQLVVTTAEAHAITDAYALVKILAKENKCKNFSLLVNMVHSAREAENIGKRFQETCKRFLEVEVNYLGGVPYDPTFARLLLQKPVKFSPNQLSSQAWQSIALDLLAKRNNKNNFFAHLDKYSEEVV